MFNRLFYNFGFLPQLLQIVLLALCFVGLIIYFFAKKNNIPAELYPPAVLLIVSHIFERAVYSDNLLLGIIVSFSVGYLISKIFKVSTMLVVALGFIIIPCATQNVYMISLGIPVAFFLLIITIIKSIFSKNWKQMVFSIIGIVGALTMPNLSWSFNFLVTAILLLLTIPLLNITTKSSIVYCIVAVVATLFFGPWVAIEIVLITEEIIRCIKAKAPLAFLMFMLANFLTYWLLLVSFSNPIPAVISVILIVLLILYLIGII